MSSDSDPSLNLEALLEAAFLADLISARVDETDEDVRSSSLGTNNNNTADLLRVNYSLEEPQSSNTDDAVFNFIRRELNETLRMPSMDTEAAVEQLNPIPYTPTEEFASQLKFVWDVPDFRAAFKHHVEILCEISGTAEELLLTPKIQDSQFAEKSIRMIENFLYSVAIASVDLDAELIEFLFEKTEEWLHNLRKSINLVIFDIEASSLKIKGMRDDVAEYEVILTEQFQETTVTKTNMDFCRQIRTFGLLEEINHNLGNRVKLFPPDNDTYTLFGRKCFLNEALETIENFDLDSSNQGAPEISNHKLHVLEKILSHENKNEYQDFVQAKFEEENIECVLSFDSSNRTITLMAKTNDMHEKGSNCLDEILQSFEIPLPEYAPPEVFELDSWKNTVTRIELTLPVMVQHRGGCACLDGFLDSVLPEVTEAIDQFMMGLENIKKITCQDGVKQFARKHIVPDWMEVTEIRDGLLVKSPLGEIDTVETKIQNTSWTTSSKTFGEPGVLAYFKSKNWRSFLKLLERTIHCSVVCDFNESGDSEAFEYKNNAGSVMNGDISVNFHWPDTKRLGSEAVQLAEKRAKHLLNKEACLQITTDAQRNIPKAEHEISQHVNDAIETKTVSDDILTKLDHNDRFDIYQAAITCGAAVTFDDSVPKIVIKGWSQSVRNLYDEIQKLLYELKESVLHSDQTTWQWGDMRNYYCPFPPRVSRVIENKFKMNRAILSTISIFNCNMELNFMRMTYKYNNTIGQLRRSAPIADSDIPPDWSDTSGEQWNKTPLDRHSTEFNEILSHFMVSDPPCKKVNKIERIQNPAMYKQYQIRRKEVEKQMVRNQHVETLLFHGTSQEDAEKICSDGFDRGFAGKNATRYGSGCYFARDSRYSAGYAPENASGKKCMFVARVLTGEFCKGEPHMRTAPEKPALAGSISRKYDSVVDDMEEPTIFVVFKDWSCYPHYLITYTP